MTLSHTFCRKRQLNARLQFHTLVSVLSFVCCRMTYLSLSHYLELMDRCWRSNDGPVLASLVSLRHDHVNNKNFLLDRPETMVQKFMSTPFDEIVAHHLRCIYALHYDDFREAYQRQSTLVQSLIKMLQSQKEENWLLPVMYTVCLDLRLLAQGAEKERSGGVERYGDILEKAAECLMGCFRFVFLRIWGAKTYCALF